MSIVYNDDNTFIFTIGRMNPPTPGHMLVIRALIDTALEKGVSIIYVILTSTLDRKNPIDCEKKRAVLYNKMIDTEKQLMIDERPDLQEKINTIKVEIICTKLPFTPITDFVKTHDNVNLFMIIGEDRQSFIDTIAKTYFFGDKYKDNVQFMDAMILRRPDMERYASAGNLNRINVGSIPREAMSASFIRKIVEKGDRQKFSEIYRPYVTNIDGLFDTIEHGIRTLPQPKEKDEKIKPLQYTYPLIKPDMMTNGGKRTKQMKNRTHKKNRKRKTAKK